MAPLWISSCGWPETRDLFHLNQFWCVMCERIDAGGGVLFYFFHIFTDAREKWRKGRIVKIVLEIYLCCFKHKRMNHIKSLYCVWRWVYSCSHACKLHPSLSVFLLGDFVSAAPLDWANLHEILKAYFTRRNHKLNILWKQNWFALMFFCLSDHVYLVEVRLHTLCDFNVNLKFDALSVLVCIIILKTSVLQLYFAESCRSQSLKRNSGILHHGKCSIQLFLEIDQHGECTSNEPINQITALSVQMRNISVFLLLSTL